MLLLLPVLLGGHCGAQAEVDPNLPVEIQSDLLMSEVKAFQKAERWKEAAESLERVSKLGVPLPPPFHYSFGKALLAAGRREEGVAQLTTYMVKTGTTNDEFFSRALSLLRENTRAGKLDPALTGALRLEVTKEFIAQNEKLQKWNWAADDFEELARLGELSEDCQYERADDLSKAQRFTESLRVLTDYLKTFGLTSKHYAEALKLYTQCNEGLAKAKAEAEVQNKAEEHRRKMYTCTRDDPWENSLGMKFVPVFGTKVLFSVWDTRVQDYAAYAATNGRIDGSWKSPGFEQGPTHPVVEVNWYEAKAFCKWLTQKEIAEGRLKSGQEYRLPKDSEWSVAVGLGAEQGNAPCDKDEKIDNMFPWGTQWPPPEGAGNYAKSLGVDDFEYTSPVGSFKANQYGLYDMGGNVWQWCEDWYNSEQKYRVLRGASWDSGDRGILLSSNRYNRTPERRDFSSGFRVVLAGVLSP